MQAVTRVKLEQASKVVMWMPTRPGNGEGCTDREGTRAGTRNSPTNDHLIRSTIRRATHCRSSQCGMVSKYLNEILRGWSSYFSYGTRAAAYRAVRNYVYESVRHFLRRRHQVYNPATNRFSKEAVFGELGVLQVRRAQLEPRW